MKSKLLRGKPTDLRDHRRARVVLRSAGGEYAAYVRDNERIVCACNFLQTKQQDPIASLHPPTLKDREKA